MTTMWQLLFCFSVRQGFSYRRLLDAVAEYHYPRHAGIGAGIQRQIMAAVQNQISAFPGNDLHAAQLIRMDCAVHLGERHGIPRLQLFQIAKVSLIVMPRNYQVIRAGRTRMAAGRFF